MKYASLLVAALLLLSGCSSQTIEPSYYLLRPAHDFQTRPLAPSKDFALGNVTIAPYIDQQSMLLETGAGELRPARHHLWAEPMFEGVRTYLSQEISRFKGEDIVPAKFLRGGVAVDIRIDQLHGTYDGGATLVAYWWLRSDNKVIASYQYAQSRPLAQSGYAALASAQKALLTDFASKVAASMVKSG